MERDEKFIEEKVSIIDSKIEMLFNSFKHSDEFEQYKSYKMVDGTTNVESNYFSPKEISESILALENLRKHYLNFKK